MTLITKSHQQKTKLHRHLIWIVTPSSHEKDHSIHTNTLSSQNKQEIDYFESKEITKANLKLKTNDVISFVNENNEHCVAKVIGAAGKSTGKYKTCKNIEYEEPETLAGTKTWIDTSKLQDLSVNNSNNINEQSAPNMNNNVSPTEEILETQSIDFGPARERELQSWNENNVFEVVPYANQQCVSVRWVLYIQ